MKRIIFTGGRHFDDTHTFNDAMRELADRFGEYRTVVGDCYTGLDAMIARRFSGCVSGFDMYVARWWAHGRAAGPFRNQAMVDSGADLCVAFNGGRGTADCVARCKKAGIPVWEPCTGQKLSEVVK